MINYIVFRELSKSSIVGAPLRGTRISMLCYGKHRIWFLWHSPCESRGLSASENVGPPDGGNIRSETSGLSSVNSLLLNEYWSGHISELQLLEDKTFVMTFASRTAVWLGWWPGRLEISRVLFSLKHLDSLGRLTRYYYYTGTWQNEIKNSNWCQMCKFWLSCQLILQISQTWA